MPQSAYASTSRSILPSYARNTLNGQTARDRELQQRRARRYGNVDDDDDDDEASRANKWQGVRNEFDVLKENHRFIRDDEDPRDVSWEERLARAYESKLFKEFALIDLKHYKSRRIALRWRTAEEVIAAIGEETCGSLRCAYHQPPPSDEHGAGSRMPGLRSFELPFAYEEAGERKQALVKVKVCERCERKLTYRPEESRARRRGEGDVPKDRHRSASPSRTSGKRRR